MTRNARRRGLAAFLGLALSWPGGLRAQDDAPGPQSPVVQEKTQWFVCTMLVTNRTDVYFSPGFDTEAEAKAQMERDRELDTAGQYSRIWVQSGKQTTKIYPPARPKPPLPVTTPAARPGGPLRFQNLPAVVVQPHREPGSGAYNSPLANDALRKVGDLAGTTWELVSGGNPGFKYTFMKENKYIEYNPNNEIYGSGTWKQSGRLVDIQDSNDQFGYILSHGVIDGDKFVIKSYDQTGAGGERVRNIPASSSGNFPTYSRR